MGTMTCHVSSAIVFAVGLFLASCSAEAIRNGNHPPDQIPVSRDQERNAIQDQGIAFCQKYPDDIACKSYGQKR
jgi:hypothetical protein